MDKVYLPSYGEASSYRYFSKTYGSGTSITTDYARAVGALMSTSDNYYGNGVWWLRSPYYYYSNHAHFVNSGGNIHNTYGTVNHSFGARPAIKIG